MKVEELIIDGFKSYATRTVISDWDPQFNAITGLNGSGKSNILDAICFVLGITSMTTVRASNLQDLIYKRGQAGITKASVTIVFDNTDKTNSPIGFNNSAKISVTRQVVLGGTSKYLINGHRAPQQSVLQLFQSVQLNINNPNFLIMQGKITKVLNMKPKEILSLIEEAAGTKMFEDRREKAERTMAKKETKLQENRTLLQEEIEPKLEKLRNEKRIFLEFQVTQADYEKISKVIFAFDYKNLTRRYDSFQNSLNSNKARAEELNTLIPKLSNELESLNDDLGQIRSAKQEEVEKNGKISILEEKESKILNEISRTKTSLSICIQDYEENIKELDKIKRNIEENKTSSLQKMESFKLIEQEYQSINTNLLKEKEACKKKEELLSTLLTGISSTGATDGGYDTQLASTNEKLNDVDVVIKKLTMKMELLERELASNEPKLIQAKKDKEKDQQYIIECEKLCSELEEQLTKDGFDPALTKKLREKEHFLRQELHRLNNEAENLRRRVANLDFNYTKPSPDFDTRSVKGIAAQLFSLKSESMNSATALQVCAGGRLYNVVVDNEKTASSLLERGRLRKRVTIIPLNKISARTLNERSCTTKRKKLAPGKVELALNLIGYDDEVSNAMEFIFGGSLICQDADTAKKVTFHPQIRTRSITLEGDVYDPEGTLSGGSRNNSSSLLLDIQRYNESSQKLQSTEKELNEVINSLKQQELNSQRTKVIQNDLNLARHKLSLAQRSIGANNASQIAKKNEELHHEISECQQGIIDNQRLMKTLQEDVERIKRDMDEFSHDRGSKLNELKLEINDLTESINKQEKISEHEYEKYQNLQVEIEQLNSEIKSDEESLKVTEMNLDKLLKDKSEIEKNFSSLDKSLVDIRGELDEERNRLLGLDEELKELENLIKLKIEAKNGYELEYQKLAHDLSKSKANTDSIQKKIEELIKEHDWLQDKDLVEGIIGQNSGINLEEHRERSRQLEDKYQEMRRKVNINIMSMIENVEKKEVALRTMIRTIEKDKIKIQETISKLNEYKREALIKTWEKVTTDFGAIFSDLLPNSFAKLVPSEGKDVTEGLEVKVKLGTIWKESLVELSGGQRSLIALSLIMALLQFRPAPMYILDEVDAALDLSHTQNIGHLIKTRFKGSQFIVVSLKEGMFSNANRVFRTRFQNGTSVVSIM
ncbi:condensin subunit SMC2 NDAI_0G02070 [Naumovozyma dairenensis CBS 421]|uniref:Structural maintenance of chromosomes protein n=1 Tax=Naumovozyma dairenensis (strain ATCC 10597 / BCRC 20456 / CBS 421 / NBRC 0211 / NRRL Y-12639) TaxID=1071378 RepID=G0WDX1_NAUDC|nr:hypothetical protein NDAI_0G02070 [Naumovozyma dairenensis CBS 421]CCD25982.2 hypothetical protein NDAI_0G02070 [Naumovozyma dairenensis CBS 421]